MKIALDVRTVREQRAGIGMYTELLINALAKVSNDERFVLVGAPDTAWDRLPEHPRFTPHVIPGASSLWHLKAARVARQVDLYHSPSSLFVPLLVPERSVVTVHDLVPFLIPEVSSAKTWWTHRAFRITLERVRAVIADSRSTAEDLVRIVPRATQKVSTIHLAPRPAFTPSKGMVQPFPCTYFLAVGTLEPRKNLAMLLRAYKRAVEADPELPKLVIAGKLGWKNAEFEGLMADPGLRERVQLAGYVSDDALLELFRGAMAFIYPSRYEGFGLPVLEAMACGIPVVTSSSSSLPEVGGEAALYMDPSDEESLSRYLLELRDPGLRQERRQRGLEQAARFNWEETARQTLSVYHRVLGRAAE